MSQLDQRAAFDVAQLRARLCSHLDEGPLPQWRVITAVIAVVAVASLWAFSSTGPFGSPSSAATSKGNSGVPMEKTLPRASATSIPVSAGSTAQPTGNLTVQVSGAVLHPGVVTVPGAARVHDAVDAAGGFGPGADLDRINLAAKVTDGQHLFVLKVGQGPPPADSNASTSSSADSGATGGSDAVVDVNTADAAALDALPGVGPSTARAIIQQRSTDGPFKSVDDVGKVKGIGPAKLAQLRPHITV